MLLFFEKWSDRYVSVCQSWDEKSVGGKSRQSKQAVSISFCSVKLRISIKLTHLMLDFIGNIVIELSQCVSIDLESSIGGKYG